MILLYYITSCARRNMNLHFDVSMKFYQLDMLVRQDMTNATEYFVADIVKINNFILLSLSINSQQI